MRAFVLALAVVLMAAPSAATPPPAVTGDVHSVTVVKGESLRTIGSRYGVDPATIASDNSLRASAPLRNGVVLRLDNRHIVPEALVPGTIVINVPQRLLFFAGADEFRALPIAVGRPSWRTPLKPFTIATKEIDPSWEVPPSILEEARRAGKSQPPVVPPGPDNPLGKHWLGLSIGGVGIHGTNAPSSVYQSTTHGCIRLHPDDIAWLFGEVEVGTPGQFIYEPVLLAARGGEVFLEVHRDVYRLGPPDALEYVRERAAALGVSDLVDWLRAADVVAAHDGVARVVTRAGR